MAPALFSTTRELGTTIRFFVSSTFADFQHERTLLQQQVFPTLRQRCAQAGFRLQPIDLRWGVSAAASAERQTLQICFEELERCQQLSPDFFLLILLGDRYGSCFLPEHLPAAHVAQLRPLLNAAAARTLDLVYALDTNAIPQEYVLRRSDHTSRDSQPLLAVTDEEALRLALAQAAQTVGYAEEARLPFVASATHQEIQRGLLAQPQMANGVLAAFRHQRRQHHDAPGG